MIEDAASHVLAHGTIGDRCYLAALLSTIANVEMIAFIARRRRWRDPRPDLN